MTRTFRRIIATGILFIAIAAGAVALVTTGGCSSSTTNSQSTGNVLEDLKNGVVNTAVDITGVKSLIDSNPRDKAGALAAGLGVSQSVADEMIDSLAIQDWRATSLPEDAKEASSSSVNVNDMDVDITTYEDPSIVTVGAFGLDVTLEVPESAQVYTPFLEYLQYLS